MSERNFDRVPGSVVMLREYQATDCAALVDLFRDTVRHVNIKDYSQAQIAVWAPSDIDTEAWGLSFERHYTIVAAVGETIVGFGDIDKTGYLDRLYIHKDYQRQGIASAVCDAL